MLTGDAEAIGEALTGDAEAIGEALTGDAEAIGEALTEVAGVYRGVDEAGARALSGDPGVEAVDG